MRDDSGKWQAYSDHALSSGSIDDVRSSDDAKAMRKAIVVRHDRASMAVSLASGTVGGGAAIAILALLGLH